MRNVNKHVAMMKSTSKNPNYRDKIIPKLLGDAALLYVYTYVSSKYDSLHPVPPFQHYTTHNTPCHLPLIYSTNMVEHSTIPTTSAARLRNLKPMFFLNEIHKYYITNYINNAAIETRI